MSNSAIEHHAGPAACRGFLVLDWSGFAHARLDSNELEPVDLSRALEFASTGDSLAESPIDVPPLGPGTQIRSVTPSVLRVDERAALAWDADRRRYVALQKDHLRLLDLARAGSTVDSANHHMSDEHGSSAGRVAATLAALGLLAVEEPDSEEQESEFSPWPESTDETQPNHEELADLGSLPGHRPDTISPEQVEPLGSNPDDQTHESSGPEEAPSVTADLDSPSRGAPRLLDDLPDRAAFAAYVVAFRAQGRIRRYLRRRSTALLDGLARRAARRLESSGSPTDEDSAVDLSGHESTSALDDESAEIAPQGLHPHGDAAGAEQPAPEFTSVSGTDSTSDLEAVDEAATADGSNAPTNPSHIVDGSRDHRVPVYGVYYSPEHNANLGLGLIFAHARSVDHGALTTRYDLRRASIDAVPMLEELEATGRAAVVLFSDYMWSIEHNLSVSAKVKELNPRSLTVHGGPHAPKYEADAARFFDEHPHVDVIVRGEGELTVAELLRALDGDTDPTARRQRLGEVSGITFRVTDGGGSTLVRTPDRERAAEMDQFPSPYLTGEFDHIDPSRWRSATIETNRGCPYGCTFCDWGSATMSRIRKFGLDRVFAELEWVAARGISEIFLADSNFGMHARDVEIAQRIAELKRQYGTPHTVICSFAKNTVKHTAEIVRIWVESGICAEGSVALQTTDPITLTNVKRSNIKVEKYDELADEFRRNRLPIVTDLLMGLPGATVESFKNDLQRCLDQEVTPRMMETVVLPNSPMNEPSYRDRFAIEVDESNIIVSTSSYTRDDFEEMKRIRLLFRALEHFGLMRHLFLWLQHERGIRAVEFLHDIDRALQDDPYRYPLLTWVGRYFDVVTAPPGGWPPFYDEVVQLLSDRHDIHEDSSLRTVLTVQEFVLPRKGRRFPDTVELPHDYVAWHSAVKSGGSVPALSSFGPGRFSVDDPNGVCEHRVVRNGFSIRREEACDNPFWVLNDWELDSPLMRPMSTAVGLLPTA